VQTSPPGFSWRMAVVMVMVLIPAAAHSEGTSATPVTPPKPAERARPAGPDKVRTQEAPPDTFEKGGKAAPRPPGKPGVKPGSSGQR